MMLQDISRLSCTLYPSEFSSASSRTVSRTVRRWSAPCWDSDQPRTHNTRIIPKLTKTFSARHSGYHPAAGARACVLPRHGRCVEEMTRLPVRCRSVCGYTVDKSGHIDFLKKMFVASRLFRPEASFKLLGLVNKQTKIIKNKRFAMNSSSLKLPCTLQQWTILIRL